MTGPVASLRERRLAVALDRAQLARIAGVSVHTIRALEKGERGGRPATWKRLDAALVVAAVDAAERAEAVYEAAP